MQALSRILPTAYYVYLFTVSFWLTLEGLNLILVATSHIFHFFGHAFFIGTIVFTLTDSIAVVLLARPEIDGAHCQ